MTASSEAGSGVMDRHGARLVDGPILGTLLRLAAPTVAVMAVQAAINVTEAYFIGRLGTDALAGVSLVFPLIMLMQMMAAGGMGGGVSSAVARALGAGRRGDAEALAFHALLLALALGLFFTAALLGLGPRLYRALGGEGEALANALAYSGVVFSAAGAVWLVNTLAAVLRGTGNMLAPAIVIFAGACIVVPLSPSLIFGWGPMPRLGIAGAGVAVVSYYILATLALGAYLASGRAAIRLRFRGIEIRWVHFAEILRVGGISAVMTVLANLNVVVITGIVGGFGTVALAGYGMAARLDYLLIPFLFSLGSAGIAMVGAAIGAGRRARAERIAWTAAALGAGLTEIIGLAVALAPQAWMGMFSAEPGVIAAGATYLRIVGPFYGSVGVFLLLYFTSQGAGRMLWPFIAGMLRLLVSVIGGLVAVAGFGSGLPALYGVVAAAMTLAGVTVALALRLGAWRVAAGSPSERERDLRRAPRAAMAPAQRRSETQGAARAPETSVRA